MSKLGDSTEVRAIQASRFRVSLSAYDLVESAVLAPSAKYHSLWHISPGARQKVMAHAASQAFGPRPLPCGITTFVPAAMPTTFKASPGELRVCRLRFDQEVVEALFGARVTWRFENMAPFISVRPRSILFAMQQLKAECQNPGLARRCYVDALGTAIVVDLCRRFANVHGGPGEPSGLLPWQLKRIDEVAREVACSGQDSVAQFAAHCGISEIQLLRCFKNTTGTTLGAYVQAIRIEQAKEMLAEGQKSIKDIAGACGFSTPEYFSTVFYRAAGEAPQEYRIRARGGLSALGGLARS